MSLTDTIWGIPSTTTTSNLSVSSFFSTESFPSLSVAFKVTVYTPGLEVSNPWSSITETFGFVISLLSLSSSKSATSIPGLPSTIVSDTCFKSFSVLTLLDTSVLGTYITSLLTFKVGASFKTFA